MNNIKKLLFLAVASLSSMLASAYDFQYEGLNYDILNDHRVAVSGYYSVDDVVIIPGSVDYNGETYTVTEIGEFAFNYFFGLTFVTIPNSVSSIGDYAFFECRALSSVNIPDSVTTIGELAFGGCTCLTSVTIPDSVISIGDAVFTGCKNLSAFYGKYASVDNRCLISDSGILISFAPSGLTEYVISESVTSIGKSAFFCCSHLSSVKIPKSVTSIGDTAFYGCSGLISVTIPNSVTSIGSGAFFFCTGLTSVTIPNSVTYIGDSAFSGCSVLTSVTIPNSVTSIGDMAFAHCWGLASVTIPNSVTSIGNSAFNGCSGLISVTIPNSVTSIGDCAFGSCSGLESITCLVGDPSQIRMGSDVFDGFSYTSCTLYVPVGSKELYQQVPQWSDFTNIVEIEVEDSIIDIKGCEAGSMHIEGNMIVSAYPVSIYNLSGQAVALSIYNPSLSSLARGVYIAKTTTSTMKFVVK